MSPDDGTALWTVIYASLATDAALTYWVFLLQTTASAILFWFSSTYFVTSSNISQNQYEWSNCHFNWHLTVHINKFQRWRTSLALFILVIECKYVQLDEFNNAGRLRFRYLGLWWDNIWSTAYSIGLLIYGRLLMHWTPFREGLVNSYLKWMGCLKRNNKACTCWNLEDWKRLKDYNSKECLLDKYRVDVFFCERI